ncbi:MAG: virulence protein RhuM/Fic/DOC family protein [Gammaproteobacteria bacterium]|jgi:prophage maintenance system killer protein|nr:virulence protein RhuM/Fic/DOC family protein [Gammaproteobacteria bacterium]MBK9467098.1 virulence protein RhuM/Fic/DOC family protein [Gammaproteobacteria bacterium]MBP6479604.1 virulence protein RhuM/Fic/DOC family protein [Pseudomonadales bacterium]MBP7908567.1 virulence protein RhuM/Fic/DOC family protein [Pseudomonadales bacterium]
MSDIVIFESGDHEVEVRLQGESVWLSQAQMAALFDVQKAAISKHLKNIFACGELDAAATVSKMETVQTEGSRTVSRQLEHYNLDAIISVGYRVNSTRATRFRQWATGVLRQHLVEGYTLNQQRLRERGVAFEQAMDLLSRTLASRQMVTEEGEAVLRVIAEYARSWSLLQRYDEQRLDEKTGRQAGMRSLPLDEALKGIARLKAALVVKGEATDLFGQLRGDGLASALATIDQGFGDELFYPNVATRAAHLLYFVIKNHPLADGNKRTGSFLFLWYLRANEHLLARPVERLINDNTLVALALLVAESRPEQKELMVKLAEHFVLLKEDGP